VISGMLVIASDRTRKPTVTCCLEPALMRINLAKYQSVCVSDGNEFIVRRQETQGRRIRRVGKN
jgi:hypothetical protein